MIKNNFLASEAISPSDAIIASSSYPVFQSACGNCCGCCNCSGQSPVGPGASIPAIPPNHIVVGSGTGITDSGVPLAQIEGAIANETAARQQEILMLSTRVEDLGSLGSYIGAFDNFQAQQAPGNTIVPVNIAQFAGSASVNDFITVRQDETHGGASTRYVIKAIDTYGNITWGYDITYSTDITGKMDKIANPAPGNLIMQDMAGNAADSGLNGASLSSEFSDMNAEIDRLRTAVSALTAYLSDDLVRCPQTNRLGRRFNLVGLTGGASMSETWSNDVTNVFGPTGRLGVHTNCTFWNAQLLQGNIAASAIAIRRSGGGTGANINVYPRYTSGALGNNRATTVISFFMASNETNAELGELV